MIVPSNLISEGYSLSFLEQCLQQFGKSYTAPDTRSSLKCVPTSLWDVNIEDKICAIF